MLLLLCLFLFLQDRTSEALPVYARGAPGGDMPERRTLFTIVSGCVSTTFICSWVSIAPNIAPDSSKDGFKSLLRRLRIMFWALVVPELILLWSVRQWYAAGKIADIYNRRNDPVIPADSANECTATIRSFFSGLILKREKKTDWTRTQGHFIAMGGVVVVNEETDILDNITSRTILRNQTRAVLNSEMLKLLVKDPNFSIPVTEKEIDDKAKGDFLSKTIATLQVAWFMIQVIVRFQQKLAVTELEIVTLALASMNGVMYFFWWSKPLGVSVPMEIRIERSNFDMSIGTGGAQDGRTFIKIVTLQLPKLYDSMKLQVGRILRNEGGHPLFRWRLIFLPAYFLVLTFSPLLIVIVLIFVSVFDVMATNGIPTDVTHVPTFYYPDMVGQEFLGTITLPFSGVMFGGIHFIGWNLPYQNHADRMIWRICTVLITANPPLCALLWALSTILTKKSQRPGRFQNLLKTTAAIMKVTAIGLAIALTSAYVIARLVLLVESCVLLRHQPESAFLATDLWKYAIHF